MTLKNLNKVTLVSQWILQFLLGSFFAFVVVFYLNPRGDMGTQIAFMFLRVPFAVTLGIILGDISLYTTRKFSFMAVLASLISMVLGFYLFLLLADANMLPKIICIILGFAGLVLPSLIVYNAISYSKRTKNC